MDPGDVNTVKDAFDYLAVQLRGETGSDERRAVMVIEDLFNVSDRTSAKGISHEDRARLINTIQLIKAGVPLQYATGIAHFYGLKFQVDAHVLIPRPETEELVFEVINSLKSEKRHLSKVLDIGTGSGCIALTIKKHFPDLNVYAMDKSLDALQVAEKNAHTFEVEVHLIHDDITNIIDPTLQTTFFDYIISNPPYIQETERQLMDDHVLGYEPEEALFPANQDPLQMYNAIISYAMEHLIPGGFLFLELNEFLAFEIAELASEKGFLEIDIILDLQEKKRILKALK